MSVMAVSDGQRSSQNRKKIGFTHAVVRLARRSTANPYPREGNMPKCQICGCETRNKVACPQHSRINSLWKSYNKIRERRGHAHITWPEYEQHRKKEFLRNPKPRLFRAEDMTGPDVVWDGTDRSPCQHCEHGNKDHGRYGCIKCVERHRYAVSHGDYLVRSHYSQVELTAVVCSRR
jgi:hypothetical protein